MSKLPKFRLHFGYLLLTILLFLVEIAIAKYIIGWIRSYIGDVLVVILIYSALMSIVNFNKKVIILSTLIFAFAIEFSQYFKLAARLGCEQGSVAYIVLGNTFSVADLVCYTLGCLIILLVEGSLLSRLRWIV